MTNINAILINSRDNVAVAINDIKPGELICYLNQKKQKISTLEKIPRNHKVALFEIPSGAKIIKYGEAIGIATRNIQPGEWVHTHNMKSEDS